MAHDPLNAEVFDPSQEKVSLGSFLIQRNNKEEEEEEKENLLRVRPGKLVTLVLHSRRFCFFFASTILAPRNNSKKATKKKLEIHPGKCLP